MTHTFANGCQVVTMGILKCSLVVTPEGNDSSPLLIDRIHYEAVSHVEYVARASMIPQVLSQGQKDLLAASASAGGAGGGGNGGTESRNQTPMAQAPTPTMTPKTTSGESSSSGTTTRKGKGKAASAAAGEKDEGGVGGEENGNEGGAGGGGGNGGESSSLACGGTGNDLVTSTPMLYSLPERSVNDFGISPGMMRCLEVSSGFRDASFRETR